MGSDRARRSYDATRMYRSVVSQQGRVTVEADANEGEEIRAEESRADLIDVIGPIGAPADGFKISVPPGAPPFDFAIGAGVLYVGGMRVVNADPQATYVGQRKTEWIDYRAGPALDEPKAAPLSELVYLAITEQEVSAVEDPVLREPALGGPDTAARTRLLQRVQRHGVDGGRGCDSSLAIAFKAIYGGHAKLDRATMRLESLARLRVDFVPATAPADACQPTAQAGFLGPDNQLIRLQVSEPIDDDGQQQQAFLWGWDNASSLYRVSITTPGPKAVLTLQGIPVDMFHEPRQGQRVELLGTAVELGGDAYVASETGPVLEVGGYERVTRTLTLTTAISADFVANHPLQLFIRIWENQLPFAASATTPVELVAADGTSTGVVIYAQHAWLPGDYWMIGVRPSTPMAILPERLAGTEPQPPDGPRRWLAPLAVIDWPATGSPTVSDCRPTFLDLVELTQRKGGSCELVVAPGEDIQRAIDSLPDDGGAVCLKAGTHHIDKALRISRSFVTLHGESGGTIVETEIQAPVAADTSAMLDIIAGDQGLTDVVVRDIAFLVSKPAATPAFAPFIRIAGCSRAQIRGCRFTAPQFQKNTTTFGLLSADACSDMTVADNTAGPLAAGMMATACLGQTDILRNALVGYSFTVASNPPATASHEYSVGKFGISLAGGSSLARARVEHNQLEHFEVGVLVSSDLDCSTVAHNTVRRALWFDPSTTTPAPTPFPDVTDFDGMNKYVLSRTYAVMCLSSLCTIRANRIDLQSSKWGGINTLGSGTLVEANLIESEIDIEKDRGMPAGIHCIALANSVDGAHGSLLRDNVLTGSQAAITITGCNEVEASRNRIDGAGRAAHGIRVDDATGALIRDNRIARIEGANSRPAIFAGDGDRSRIEGNHIDGCALGIRVQQQADIAIVGNHIEYATQAAIWAEPFDLSAIVCENRIFNCGFAVGTSDPCVGIKLIGTGAASTLRLEGCEIVDLGISPLGDSGVEFASAITVENLAACQLVGNRVDYTEPSSLDLAQARPPLLVSGVPVAKDKPPLGRALISDNDLAGSAGPDGVALMPYPGVVVVGQVQTTDRGTVVNSFKKVTFSNNICRHFTKISKNPVVKATVQLTGTHLIAMGNHVEASDPVTKPDDPPIDPTTVSIMLNQLQRALLIGNVTSGPLVPPPVDPTLNEIL